MYEFRQIVQRKSHMGSELQKAVVYSRDVQGGPFSSGPGRGEDENPRAGPGRGQKARKLTDPKMRQKCVNCY